MWMRKRALTPQELGVKGQKEPMSVLGTPHEMPCQENASYVHLFQFKFWLVIWLSLLSICFIMMLFLDGGIANFLFSTSAILVCVVALLGNIYILLRKYQETGSKKIDPKITVPYFGIIWLIAHFTKQANDANRKSALEWLTASISPLIFCGSYFIPMFLLHVLFALWIQNYYIILIFHRRGDD